jgi:hypothetical protein
MFQPGDNLIVAYILEMSICPSRSLCHKIGWQLIKPNIRGSTTVIPKDPNFLIFYLNSVIKTEYIWVCGSYIRDNDLHISLYTLLLHQVSECGK